MSDADMLRRLEALGTRVGALEAREDIRRQLDAYALAIDLRDRDALSEVFTDDVEFVVTTDGSVRHGWSELWRYLADLLAPMGPTVHYAVGGVDIDVDPGLGAATSRHLGIAQHERDGAFVAAALTYHHAWRREPNARWRISRRAIQPWYFCRLEELVAHGWDPTLPSPDGGDRSSQPDASRAHWLPWAEAAWQQRIDRADANY